MGCNLSCWQATLNTQAITQNKLRIWKSPVAVIIHECSDEMSKCAKLEFYQNIFFAVLKYIANAYILFNFMSIVICSNYKKSFQIIAENAEKLHIISRGG